MDFADRILRCADCGEDFIFTAGEQLFFFDKQFTNDPKRCKACKAKRAAGPQAAGKRMPGRVETRTNCSGCGIETTVPFKPTQGRPVLCRACFQAKPNVGASAETKAAVAEMVAAEPQIEIAVPLDGPELVD